MHDLNAVKNRYEQELTESIIPFWQTHCIDNDGRGFHTFLDRDGSLYDNDKYMWMQWRIVYTFAKISQADYGSKEHLAIAQKGYEFLVSKGKAENGNYYFCLNGDGEPAVAPYNIYSECFASMAAATLFDVTKEDKYREEAVFAMDKYLSRIPDPKGQWDKALSGKRKFQSLGHYMMLANMGLIMNRCLESDEYTKDIERRIYRAK